MIITIDSNVASVPVEVVRLLPHRVVSAPWCTDPCVCKSIDGTSDRVLYDTPIAMCPDTDIMFADPVHVDNTVSFVYLDVGVRNASYRRITKNLPRFKQTVVVSANADINAEPKGTYTVALDKNNCGTDMVIKFMALMVNAFVQRKLILHPESLLNAVRKVPNQRERCIDSNGSPVRCDLYSFSKYNCTRLMHGSVLDDCDLVNNDSIPSRSDVNV